MRGLVIRVTLALCALLTWTGCRQAQGQTQRTVVLKTCRLKGVSHDALCGTVDVFEDRQKKSGRVIHLNVAVVPALAPTPEPDPLFILAGGPGQAAVELGGEVMPAVEQVLRHRDIVLVDQRGTGKSNPLDCKDDKDRTLAERLKPTADHSDLKKCLAGYDADVRLYTTPIAMDDLDQVRAALGYDRINLWGGSYGTRAALVYLRRHGAHARTAVLDGVAPPGMYLPASLGPDAQRSMDLVFRGCSEDPACEKAFPELKSRFQALLERLEKTPAKPQLADPLTGKVQPLEIGRSAFASTLRGELYLPEATVLMPYTIDRATHDDFAPFVAQAAMLSNGFAKSMSVGMFFSVMCAEDAPFVTASDLERSKDTFVGTALGKDMMDVCAFWPRGEVPKNYGEPVKSDVPTLLLSGELDPVTPPEHAEAVSKTLSHSLHLVVPGVGHGATRMGCVSKVMAQFIETGTTAGLDTSCTRKMKRPPFFVSFAGPTP